MQEAENWLDFIVARGDFYLRGHQRSRTDGEMDWEAFNSGRSGRLFMLRRKVKTLLAKLGAPLPPPVDAAWVVRHSQELWRTRGRLEDQVSRILFDEMLVMRLSSHRHHFYPRLEFSDLVQIDRQAEFAVDGMPTDYLGSPLHIYHLRLTDLFAEDDQLSIICTAAQIASLNAYRQYFLTRGSLRIVPQPGATVLDCGACIGDFSVLFAALVGPSGAVHCFDPIPLHAKFCELQMRLNPHLAGVLHLNVLATGSETKQMTGAKSDSSRIDPGAIKLDSYGITTIDDYVSSRRLASVDFIKMDIEGGEMEAISGAKYTIGKFKPMLAISGYHRPEDLWEIPDRIAELNSDYRFAFGHHSPVHWESVFYASC